MPNIGLGSGMQFLIDQHLSFVRSGHNAYLRLRNFPDQQTQPYSQLGFSVVPTGTVTTTGYTDVLITPPPSVIPVSVHNIGQSMGKLRFGAKIFGVSNTFIANQAAAMGITDDLYDIFISQFVIGIQYEDMLFSIENITRRVVGGATIFWNLTCNANEVR
jgi:hypothetical protein